MAIFGTLIGLGLICCIVGFPGFIKKWWREREAGKEEKRKTKEKDLEEQKSLTELRSKIKSRLSQENTSQEPGSPS